MNIGNFYIESRGPLLLFVNLDFVEFDANDFDVSGTFIHSKRVLDIVKEKISDRKIRYHFTVKKANQRIGNLFLDFYFEEELAIDSFLFDKCNVKPEICYCFEKSEHS